MAHKCFISFKTQDHAYKKYIHDELDVDMIDKSLHEPDPEKRKVYDALYTYFLDKRQDEIIKRKDFVRW